MREQLEAQVESLIAIIAHWDENTAAMTDPDLAMQAAQIRATYALALVNALAALQ